MVALLGQAAGGHVGDLGQIVLVALGRQRDAGHGKGEMALHLRRGDVGDLDLFLDLVRAAGEGQHPVQLHAADNAAELDGAALAVGQIKIASLHGPLALGPGRQGIPDQPHGSLGHGQRSDQVDVLGILSNGFLVVLEFKALQHAAGGVDHGAIQGSVHGELLAGSGRELHCGRSGRRLRRRRRRLLDGLGGDGLILARRLQGGDRRKHVIPAQKHQQGQGNCEDDALIAIH